PWPLYSRNAALFAGEHYFPMVPWRLVFALGLVGLVPALRRKPGLTVPACVAAYVAFYMIFFGQARFRLPIEGIFIAGARAAAGSLSAALPSARRARAPAWGRALAILLLLIFAESSASAAAARGFLRSRESLLEEGGRIPIVAGAEPSSLFPGDRIDLDRAAGRYLRVDFRVLRRGPAGAGEGEPVDRRRLDPLLPACRDGGGLDRATDVFPRRRPARSMGRHRAEGVDPSVGGVLQDRGRSRRREPGRRRPRRARPA